MHIGLTAVLGMNLYQFVLLILMVFKWTYTSCLKKNVPPSACYKKITLIHTNGFWYFWQNCYH